MLTALPLLIIDDLGMRKLPATAAEDLLEVIMRRYERTSTLLTSNRPIEDWGRLLGDNAAVTAMLDRLLTPLPRPQVRAKELAHPSQNFLACQGGGPVDQLPSRTPLNWPGLTRP